MATKSPRGGSKASKGNGNLSKGIEDSPTGGENNGALKVNANEMRISEINTRCNTNVDSKDVQKVGIRLYLEPGKIYQFRMAATNVAGIGPWSEVSMFKVPEAEPNNLPVPMNIKLSGWKDDGVMVSWDMPPNAKNIKEYRGFVAVKCTDGSKNEYRFMPIYIGTEKYFILRKETMEMAAIDKTVGKPAILLRIVAKSDLGYGPAIHIRCVKN